MQRICTSQNMDKSSEDYDLHNKWEKLDACTNVLINREPE